MSFFNAPMATVAETKARMGIRAGEAEFDPVLSEILAGVSTEIEAAAQRRLRRAHRVTEYSTGGRRLIALRYFPIANIESIQESETRDFETAGAYTELEEGRDYILEPDDGVPGSSGILRRIDRDWLGDNRRPGMVRIIYTGGYKTIGEASIEDGSTEISQVERIKDFAVTDESQGGIVDEDEDSLTVYDTQRPVVRFDTDGLILPTWTIIQATLTISAKLAPFIDVSRIIPRVLGETDPIATAASVVFEKISSEGILFTDTDDTGLVTDSFVTKEMSILVDSYRDIVNNMKLSTAKGFIAFGFVLSSADGPYIIATKEQEDGALRPSLVIRHQASFSENFSMPDDIRNACIAQAIHEFQIRRSPGRLESSMRGVSIASGSFEKYEQMALLPGVLAIAKRYRRRHGR